MVEDNYEDFEKNFEQEEGDDLSQIDAYIVQVYLATLEADGIKFPKEDPLGYVWTEERLKEYITAHWPKDSFLPWEPEYPKDLFRWVGKKASKREKELEAERRRMMNCEWLK